MVIVKECYAQCNEAKTRLTQDLVSLQQEYSNLMGSTSIVSNTIYSFPKIVRFLFYFFFLGGGSWLEHLFMKATGYVFMYLYVDFNPFTVITIISSYQRGMSHFTAHLSLSDSGIILRVPFHILERWSQQYIPTSLLYIFILLLHIYLLLSKRL
jgi:hypothetical protein